MADQTASPLGVLRMGDELRGAVGRDGSKFSLPRERWLLLFPIRANHTTGSLQPIHLQHSLPWLVHGNRCSIRRDRECVESKTMQGRYKALIVEPDPYQIIRLVGWAAFEQDSFFVAAPLKSSKTCTHPNGFRRIGEVPHLKRIAILEKADLFAGRREGPFPRIRIDPRDLAHALVTE